MTSWSFTRSEARIPPAVWAHAGAPNARSAATPAVTHARIMRTLPDLDHSLERKGDLVFFMVGFLPVLAGDLPVADHFEIRRAGHFQALRSLVRIEGDHAVRLDDDALARRQPAGVGIIFHHD